MSLRKALSRLVGLEAKLAHLESGTAAPNFTLKTFTGAQYRLSSLLQKGPAVLAFFKVSCPTCQYAFPFLERLFQAYKNQGVTLVGVSQNEAADTKAFAKEFGIHFPILLDDTKTYSVSNAYGLTNVPTLFWIGQDGEIEVASVGWVKKDFEEINGKLAEGNKVAAAAIFQRGEEVRDYKAG